ncbi:MAG: hypothetical protein M3O36_21970, partial [Myxococcota bacterium]|nr:hypothetical protein [Myxococcota bacterium]
MSRKGRLSRSKNERSLSAGDNRAPSAPLPEGKSEPLSRGLKGEGSLPAEPRSRQTQTTFASPTPAVPERDDRSVPPVDIDARFFDSAFDGAHAAWEPATDLEARDPRVAIKWSPTAARRRAHLAKYVKVAVALSSALC